MPAMYSKQPGILEETISKIAYNTEYSTSFTGASIPLHHVRIPTSLRRTAWDEAHNPLSSRVVQPPFRDRRPCNRHPINLQGLQPNPTPSRAKSAMYWRRPGNTISDYSRTSHESSPIPRTPTRPSTAELLRRPPSMVARRPQTLQSRYPKDFRYFDKQCFFHPAKEPRRGFFVISPEWVSERKSNFIRKNNVFG